MNHIKFKKLFDNQLSILLESKSPDTPKYLKTLRGDQNLSTYWGIINNLETSSFETPNDAMDFLNENILMAKKVNLAPIENMTKSYPDPKYTQLDEAINTVLFTPKTPLGLQSHLSAKKLIVENLLSNHAKKVALVEVEKILGTTDDLLREYMDSSNDVVFLEGIRTKALEYLQEELSNTTEPDAKLLIYEAKDKVVQMDLDFTTIPALVELIRD